MSLQRRIAAAATLAVAAVCLIFAPASYLFTRAKMIGEVKQELRTLAAPYLKPHEAPPGSGSRRGATSGAITVPEQSGTGHGGSQPADSTPSGQAGAGTDHDGATVCASRDYDDKVPEAFGGAAGHFQTVCPDGRVLPIGGGIKLPVSKRALRVAQTLKGPYFFDANVDHHHLEIYVAPDTYDRHAIEGDLPLATVDSTLHGLLLTYGLMVAAGILLAALFGALIARSALAPIRRFTSQTEQITSALDKPRHLDEEGAIEIRRLAASFNQTLGALERSVEAQRHLIADASHELRTPIAALRSNIQIFLEADQLPAQEQAELRDAIIAELDDLTQLVADVLALARGATPNEAVEELELDAIVAEATERAIRRSQTITFRTELEPTIITNSPDRVTRAVTNVVDNARRWSPPDGSVEITLAAGVLTVRDHGPGFRTEDLAHVFERFYRSDDARRMPGSGLGLAIVKQAAEAHGGYATVSNAPDGGAIVTVSFGSAQVGSPELSAYP
jgi:two-component system sensor histidine kinase MprB